MKYKKRMTNDVKHAIRTSNMKHVRKETFEGI